MRLTRAFGLGILLASLVLGLGSTASSAEETTAAPTSPAPAGVAADESTDATPGSEDATSPSATGSLPQGILKATTAVPPPYGTAYPVTLETNFSRPYRSISSSANSDFSLLNDLERLIRGSYLDPRTGRYRTDATSNYVYMSISRMENSHRVGRELVKAAKRGVKVRVIHGKASQSKESRALASALKNATYKGKHYGAFKICQKGKSLACLASGNGAIMHSKILLVSSTFTRDNRPARAAIWSGSANLGGPSGERTYNNGLTVYNDQKLWYQTTRMWSDMYAERNVGNNYLGYVAKNSTRYGYSGAKSDGYTDEYARKGMFYSNLANVTIYATPISATPTNNRDPVMELLNRIVPDDKCRIRLQENRFKYRRIAVAQKLVELADNGCTVEAVGFEDDLKVNRAAHCQQYVRICRPILDVFKSAKTKIPVAWAKPHDKTILVEARLKRSALNPDERTLDGQLYPTSDAAAVWTTVVQAGSAALTGSNLIVSDEITTETTDPGVYADYLEHWGTENGIKGSHEYRAYPY